MIRFPTPLGSNHSITFAYRRQEIWLGPKRGYSMAKQSSTDG